jgi:thiamine pyrophosphate-dependent acetolactate synthase large subunit-like protein
MPKRCADVLVEHLISKGIKYVFTIPGGAESTLNDALYDAE